MEDKITKSNLKDQIKNIKLNNSNNLEAMVGIEMLITSNNNGTTKDENISRKYNELKQKINEITSITDEFMSMLN